MFINSIANQKRLKLISDFSEKDAIEQLNSAIATVLNDSDSLHKIVHFFSLMDIEPDSELSANFPSYTIGDRKITIIKNSQQLESAMNSIISTNIIGFDTEEKPIFSKDTKPNGTAVVQLANDSECHIIQVKFIENLTPLKKLLEDKEIIKVGINLRRDKKALFNEFGFKIESIVDLQDIFKVLTSRRPIGAKHAATLFLEKNLQKSKKMTKSNWELKKLTDNQIKYAAEDATVMYDVMIHLLKKYPFFVQVMPQWFQNKYDVDIVRYESNKMKVV